MPAIADYNQFVWMIGTGMRLTVNRGHTDYTTNRARQEYVQDASVRLVFDQGPSALLGFQMLDKSIQNKDAALVVNDMAFDLMQKTAWSGTCNGSTVSGYEGPTKTVNGQIFSDNTIVYPCWIERKKNDGTWECIFAGDIDPNEITDKAWYIYSPISSSEIVYSVWSIKPSPVVARAKKVLMRELVDYYASNHPKKFTINDMAEAKCQFGFFAGWVTGSNAVYNVDPKLVTLQSIATLTLADGNWFAGSGFLPPAAFGWFDDNGSSLTDYGVDYPANQFPKGVWGLRKKKMFEKLTDVVNLDFTFSDDYIEAVISYRPNRVTSAISYTLEPVEAPQDELAVCYNYLFGVNPSGRSVRYDGNYHIDISGANGIFTGSAFSGAKGKVIDVLGIGSYTNLNAHVSGQDDDKHAILIAYGDTPDRSSMRDGHYTYSTQGVWSAAGDDGISDGTTGFSSAICGSFSGMTVGPGYGARTIDLLDPYLGTIETRTIVAIVDAHHITLDAPLSNHYTSLNPNPGQHITFRVQGEASGREFSSPASIPWGATLADFLATWCSGKEMRYQTVIDQTTYRTRIRFLSQFDNAGDFPTNNRLLQVGGTIPRKMNVDYVEVNNRGSDSILRAPNVLVRAGSQAHKIESLLRARCWTTAPGSAVFLTVGDMAFSTSVPYDKQAQYCRRYDGQSEMQLASESWVIGCHEFWHYPSTAGTDTAIIYPPQLSTNEYGVYNPITRPLVYNTHHGYYATGWQSEKAGVYDKRANTVYAIAQLAGKQEVGKRTSRIYGFNGIADASDNSATIVPNMRITTNVEGVMKTYRAISIQFDFGLLQKMPQVEFDEVIDHTASDDITTVVVGNGSQSIGGISGNFNLSGGSITGGTSATAPRLLNVETCTITSNATTLSGLSDYYIIPSNGSDVTVTGPATHAIQVIRIENESGHSLLGDFLQDRLDASAPATYVEWTWNGTKWARNVGN